MAVLDGYQSTVSSGQEPGVYLDAISRRFLTLADAAALADVAVEQARTIVDQLLDRHVLDRGLVLACERCAYAAFYPLAELSRNFTCGRCGRSAAIRQERWKKPVDEPYWYYSLDEVAFQALSHDGWDVVEVLTQLSHHTRSFLWTPQMDFWQGDDLLGEIDIIAIADGRLIVGEAKSGDRLEHGAGAERKAVARLVQLAEHLTADTLVLASRTTWSQRTRQAIATAVASQDLETRFFDTIGS